MSLLVVELMFGLACDMINMSLMDARNYRYEKAVNLSGDEVKLQ